MITICATFGCTDGGFNNSGTTGIVQRFDSEQAVVDAMAREYGRQTRPVTTLAGALAFAKEIESSTNARIGVWVENSDDEAWLAAHD